MDLLNSKQNLNPQGFYQDQKKRRHPRFTIRRRLLIKNAHGQILTAETFDISKQGLQLRCLAKTAYQLQTTNDSGVKLDGYPYEVKIALPYMGKITECSMYCSIIDMLKVNNNIMRIGMKFLYFNANSQSRLNHFVENLTG